MIKKLGKYTVFILLVFIILNIFKNVYLYSFYNHGKIALIKSIGKKDNLFGTWEITYDTWCETIDERHFFRYVINNDSTGKFYYTYFINRIDGRPSKSYSWRALLPYNKNVKKFESDIIVLKDYILHIPCKRSFWKKDSIYFKYKLNSDSLFIDKSPKSYKYNELPSWGIDYNEKINKFDLLYINPF